MEFENKEKQKESLQERTNRLASKGITDIKGAKKIALKLFNQYNYEKRQEIQKEHTGDMMVDAYKAINKGFSPSNQDVNSYFKHLDMDKDGQLTLQDMEAVCIKYLVGPQRISIKE